MHVSFKVYTSDNQLVYGLCCLCMYATYAGHTYIYIYMASPKAVLLHMHAVGCTILTIGVLQHSCLQLAHFAIKKTPFVFLPLSTPSLPLPLVGICRRPPPLSLSFAVAEERWEKRGWGRDTGFLNTKMLEGCLAKIMVGGKRCLDVGICTTVPSFLNFWRYIYFD